LNSPTVDPIAWAEKVREVVASGEKRKYIDQTLLILKKKKT